MSYNGWTNYETWVVALWLEEEDYFSHLNEVKDDFKDLYDLAEYIKYYIDEYDPLQGECTMYSNLLSGALSEVDCREIAKHYWENLELDNDDDD